MHRLMKFERGACTCGRQGRGIYFQSVHEKLDRLMDRQIDALISMGEYVLLLVCLTHHKMGQQK